MADVSKASGPNNKRGASGSGMTWLWMILALVIAGGFLVWLGMASEPTQITVVEDGDGEEELDPLEAGATVVEKDTLAADKGRYEGELVRVREVEATGSLGPGIFWGELGDRSRQVPILVRLDSAAAAGFEMQQGGRYTVTGVVNRMTDSLATQWGEAEEFHGEGEQMQAAFTDYFIQASRVRPSRGGAGGGQQGDADTASSSSSSG